MTDLPNQKIPILGPSKSSTIHLFGVAGCDSLCLGLSGSVPQKKAGQCLTTPHNRTHKDFEADPGFAGDPERLVVWLPPARLVEVITFESPDSAFAGEMRMVIPPDLFARETG